MKYNGFYFWMFKGPMKKVLTEKYGREYAGEIMKKAKRSIGSWSSRRIISVTITPWRITSFLRSRSSHPMWRAKRKYRRRPCRR